MRLSKKYPVPRDVGLLYEFVNSVDLRRFVEQGEPHTTHDEFATLPGLEAWMRTRHLLEPAAHITAPQYQQALELRKLLREFFRIPPAERNKQKSLTSRLNEVSKHYPMVVKIAGDDVVLQPAEGASGLGRILADLNLLDGNKRLGRMKVCASEECNWVFFDRSKPGTRRWCSATLCGNRNKTRAYRQRQRDGVTE